MSEIYEKLLRIQTTLKAPKKQFNKFGNYKYRSCEDILEALKPILAKEKVCLVISDEIVSLAGTYSSKIQKETECEETTKQNRFYVKATATLTDSETGETVSACGWAREEESKKGMDGSQVTGASSSYARKYALNGLFAIDDNRDSDTTNDGKSDSKKSASKDDKLAKAQDAIVKLCVELGGKENERLMTTLKKYSSNGNPKAIKNLEKATELYNELKAMKA